MSFRYLMALLYCLLLWLWRSAGSILPQPYCVTFWKQDQNFLEPPLSLVVPSHGAFILFYSCIYFGCLTPWNVLAFSCNSQLLRWFISSLPSEFSLALNGTDLDGSLLHCTSPPKHGLPDLVLTQDMIVEQSGWVVAYLVLLSAFWYGCVHSSCVFSCFLWYLLAKTSKISLALPLTALEEALFWADRCNFF